MFSKVTVLLAVCSAVSGQINGEFWWLNNDLRKLKTGTVAAPKFDDVNELDTDETARVIFKDDEEAENSKTDFEKYPKLGKVANISLNAIHFRDETSLAQSFNKFISLNSNNKLWDDSNNSYKKKASNENADEFRLVFPSYSDDSLGWTSSENVTETAKKSTLYTGTDQMNGKNVADNIMPYNVMPSLDKDQLHPENICTYIIKSECLHNKGTLYSPALKSEILETISNEQIVCCILPIKTTPISKIVFPGTSWRTRRLKRSNAVDINPSLKQRNVLISRKYVSNNQRIITTSAPRNKLTKKVVNSDEYNSDPYWNIKNSNIRNPDIPMYQDPDSAYDDGSQSYGEDYTVELPRPGLIGLYSDHRQTSWTHNNKGFAYDTPDSVEEEFESPLGYSSIDPRLDHRSSSEAPKFHRRRPSKLTETSSGDPMRNSQRQTISFHSHPDFQVLQGFKLLNLARKKNRFVRSGPEIATDCESHGSITKSKPQKLTMHSDEDYDDNIFETNLKDILFNECRKTVKISNCENGKEQGLVEFGEHPWITLVVLTKNQEHILCYATLVHARVAISAANCVNGQSPGAVSIIAGVRNLDEDLAHSQRRMVSIFLDSKYTKGNFGLNLALLHWKLPLILDAKVQPTCLSDLRDSNDCVLVGWGGYDQEMRSELRWQRASILAPQNCNKRLSKLEVNDALCAVVESRGTVSGVGGPLLCKTAERWSTVGVAVWRDEVIILLPPRDWVLRNMANLQIP